MKPPRWTLTKIRMIQRYRVYGRVQGVGFRAFVWRAAQQLQIDGWARNCNDGTVEVLAGAEPAAHDRFLAELNEGPRWSEVTRVEVSQESENEPIGSGFHVRSDL
ncbi:MAG: acylphosphatase [bacterium]|nr:acylphosphatase [bacterium]